jgi:hypothetical protein
MVRHFY